MSKSFEPPRALIRATQPWIAALARSITVGVLAGFLAGMVTGGLGSRVVMRISGMAAGSTMQGVLTEQEAVVGEIIRGGTFFLIFIGGFLGVITSFSLPSLFSLVAHGFGFFIAVLIGAAVSFGFGEGGNTSEFLRFIGIYVLLIPAIASGLLARHVRGFQQSSDLRRYPGALAVAWAVLTPPVVVGVVLIALALIQIFAASG
jgi:hypothetical protein